jgi:hypothetical protein
MGLRCAVVVVGGGGGGGGDVVVVGGVRGVGGGGVWGGGIGNGQWEGESALKCGEREKFQYCHSDKGGECHNMVYCVLHYEIEKKMGSEQKS